MTGKSLTDEFLETYKTLEGLVRSVLNMESILVYESTLTSDDMDRMRLCRQTRNYIQHNADGMVFVQPTQAMLSFLRGKCVSIRASQKTVKDMLYRLQALSVDDTLGMACKRFAKTKRQWLPVISPEGVCVGVLSETRLIQALDAHGRLDVTLDTAVPVKDLASEARANVIFVPATEPAVQYLSEKPEIIVVGSKDKYLGVIRWEN